MNDLHCYTDIYDDEEDGQKDKIDLMANRSSSLQVPQVRQCEQIDIMLSSLSKSSS